MAVVTYTSKMESYTQFKIKFWIPWGSDPN